MDFTLAIFTQEVLKIGIVKYLFLPIIYFHSLLIKIEQPIKSWRKVSDKLNNSIVDAFCSLNPIACNILIK